MKVGVITFSSSKDNYGQLLQCYAMQRYLSKLGHEPFLIRYQDTPSAAASFKWRKTGTYIRRLPTYLSWLYQRFRAQNEGKRYSATAGYEQRDFEGFLNRYIQLSEKIYTKDEIMRIPPRADAYLCGSDQIWGGDTAYYLPFAPDEAIKIAYAPSLGGLSVFTPEYEAQIKACLARLDFIGMREQSGVDTCHRLGFDQAVKVVDPTLLLTAIDYDVIRKDPCTKRPYLFLYLLGNPIDCNPEEVYAFARDRGYDVVYVASQNRTDAYTKTYASIEEWIGYLAGAEMVVTNSFHCVVFSLLYEKRFVSIPLTGGYARMNGRIEELLQASGLTEHVYRGNFTQSATQPDFTRFRAYRQREEHFSRKFLQRLLTAKKQ